jgi:hypothetical protein
VEGLHAMYSPKSGGRMDKANDIKTQLAHRFCETVKHGEDAHMIAFTTGFDLGFKAKENEYDKLAKDLVLYKGLDAVNELSIVELNLEVNKLRTENGELRTALGRIEQLESMPLNDKDTVLKKHNIMGSLAREALGELKEAGE